MLNHDDYGVAIICPLEVEMSAVRYMLDEEHTRLPNEEGDSNRYVCGRMGKHNVVIGYLPHGAQGVGAAAVVATDIKRTFPRATLRLLVGIGGGVPSESNDVRLGDVVVSMPTNEHGGVVQYDLGKETIAKFERKGFLEPPPTNWRTCVVDVQSKHRVEDNQISAFIDEMITKYPRLANYRRPISRDMLFMPSNEHALGELNCQKCNLNQVLSRPERSSNTPRIFYGLVASGNRVLKSAVVRDQIAHDAGGALCFEMEAAGLTNDFRCIAVRGISDYADSHKNDDWHEYGAAVAAGCAKELLAYMDPVVGTQKSTSCPNAQRTNQNQHWTIDRVTNPHFTGRAELVVEIGNLVQDALRDDLAAEQCRIVITGMGGQGKSEICLHVANRVRSMCWGVFWVDVSTTVSAESGFLNIGRLLNLPVPTIDDVRQSLANIKQSWLLILDNADDSHVDYQHYFPTGSAGVIILTSRIVECHQYATRKANHLDGLPILDACTLLKKTAKLPLNQGDDQKHVESVAVSLLNGHPLALIQAGSYIARGHCLITQYPQVFERQRKRLLTFRPQQVKSRYGDVYTTFEASATIIQTQAERGDDAASDALQLLPVLGMLAPDQLPLSLFKTIWDGAQDTPNLAHDDLEEHDDGNIERLTTWHRSRALPLLDVSGEAWDEFRLLEAVHLLEAYSLITFTNAGGYANVSTHPLIHAWAKDRQSPQQQQQSWLSTGCMIALSERRRPYWLARQRTLRPHIPAFLSTDFSTMFKGQPQAMVVRILLRCGRLLHSLRIDKELHTILQRIFLCLGLNSMNVDKKWLALYKLFGQNLGNHGQVKEAVELLKQVVEMEEQMHAEDHPSRLASQQMLAIAYRANGQALQAVRLLEQVVRIREATQAEDDPQRLASQQVLAGTYEANGQVREAVELLEQVVKIEEQTQPEDHPSRLTSQHALALAYRANGQVPQAVRLLEQVVKIREQTQPEDHPSRLASQQVLAGAYEANGQVERAVEILEQVVKIEERTQAEDHPSRLASQHALAGAYRANKQIKEAIKLLEKVVGIREQTQAEDHPSRLASQQLLAGVYRADGKISQAVELLKKVVRIQERSQAKDHPSVLISRQALAVMLWDIGQHSIAHQMMQDVVELMQGKLCDSHRERINAEEWLKNMNKLTSEMAPESHEGENDLVTTKNLFQEDMSNAKRTGSDTEPVALKDEENEDILPSSKRRDCLPTDPPLGKLELRIIKGRGLKGAKQPYYVCEFERNEYISQDSQNDQMYLDDSRSNELETMANPQWNHKVTFDVTRHVSELSISVYDVRSGVNQAISIGHARTSVEMKEPAQTLRRWLRLFSGSSEGTTTSGEILVEIQCFKVDAKLLSLDDFKNQLSISRGKFGDVFYLRKRDNDRAYVMKHLSKETVIQNAKTAHTLDENEILIQIPTSESPFVVSPKFSFRTSSDVYIMTDFLSGGNLFSELQKYGRFTEDRARFHIAELILAIKHLHEHDIVYQDLRPQNILLDANGHVALCNFGLSKKRIIRRLESVSFYDEIEYAAPETLLDDQNYPNVADFWTLGVLLFEMCCGWSPFYSEDTQQMLENIAFGKTRFPQGAMSTEGKSFVKGLLNRNPRKRLGAIRGANELMEHLFLASVDWVALEKKKLEPPSVPNIKLSQQDKHLDNELNSIRALMSINDSTLSPTMRNALPGFTFVDESAYQAEFGNAFKGFTYVDQTALEVQSGGECQEGNSFYGAPPNREEWPSFWAHSRSEDQEGDSSNGASFDGEEW